MKTFPEGRLRFEEWRDQLPEDEVPEKSYRHGVAAFPESWEELEGLIGATAHKHPQGSAAFLHIIKFNCMLRGQDLDQAVRELPWCINDELRYELVYAQPRSDEQSV